LPSRNSPNTTTTAKRIPAILQTLQQWHDAFQKFSKHHHNSNTYSSNSPNITTLTRCVPEILQTPQQQQPEFQQFSKHDLWHSSDRHTQTLISLISRCCVSNSSHANSARLFQFRQYI
jgi:hypothetical protein